MYFFCKGNRNRGKPVSKNGIIIYPAGADTVKGQYVNGYFITGIACLANTINLVQH